MTEQEVRQLLADMGREGYSWLKNDCYHDVFVKCGEIPLGLGFMTHNSGLFRMVGISMRWRPDGPSLNIPIDSSTTAAKLQWAMEVYNKMFELFRAEEDKMLNSKGAN